LQRETGERFTAQSLETLALVVIEHRKHRLPGACRNPRDVEREIEAQICMLLGGSNCVATSPQDDWVPFTEGSDQLSADKVMQASRTLLKWAADGAPMVPVEEVKTRQATCLSCPYHRDLGGCSCATLFSAINLAVPAARRDKRLGVCSLCGCAMNLKSQIPVEHLPEPRTTPALPSWCWARKET
jgi:hypothetical protein